MRKEEYKEILEKLIDLLDEGVYIVGEDGKGLFYNNAMEAIEKIKKEDVIGKEFNKVFPGIPLNESTMFKALKKNTATRNHKQNYVNLRGERITTINNSIPIEVAGKVVAAIEVARDLTNISKMSDTILELQENNIDKGKVENPPMKKYVFRNLIGRNYRFAEAIERAKKAAKSNVSVFIYGETGTGKELFAQSIHYESARGRKPFLAQNCAALPEALLEGILFGTSKGGFTGAVDRAGMFEQANGGTLLLDEISAMPYDLQSKLLRVLQEDYIRRIGGTKDIPVDVRIIAAVNEPPEELIAQGKLRKDLYYRLNVVNIQIPPLRERKDDIVHLAEHFVGKHNKKFNKQIWTVAEEAVKKLSTYDYPGNIRELENIVMQGMSMAENEHALSSKMIQLPQKVVYNEVLTEAFLRGSSLCEHMDAIEKEIIRDAMIKSEGNITKAAEILKIKRQTLQHKLKRYRIISD